ncbi:hypothetical protein [Halobacteriaceae bacterium SHR40]|uniref:hypothetical protein n=1 Tax=Halovenus amylolytica TaxID=2500550 RepID=UPI000FE3A85D
MPGPKGPEAGLISVGRTPGEGVEPPTITVTARLPHHGGLPGKGGPTGVSKHSVVAIYIRGRIA